MGQEINKRHEKDEVQRTHKTGKKDSYRNDTKRQGLPRERKEITTERKRGRKNQVLE